MTRPARIAIGALAVLVIGLLFYFAIQIFAPAVSSAVVTGLRYSQTQTVPDFDTSPHTVTDPERLDAFTTLVKKYAISVQSFDESLNDRCTGGLQTTVTVMFASGPNAELRLYDCSKPLPKGTFVTDATALFTGWSAAGR